MSGWYGSMDISGLGNGLGHNHTQAYREFNEASAQSEAPYAASQVVSNGSSNGSSMSSVAKKAAVGLVAGAVVGMVLLKVPMYNSMMSKDKSWQAAALGAAVAVPLAAMYA